MKIDVDEAETELSALINAALAGEPVVLTKRGRPVAEIKPLPEAKRTAVTLEAVRKIVAEAKSKVPEGVSAATADNFLYDGTGMPSYLKPQAQNRAGQAR